VGENMNIVKNNTEALLTTSKEVDIESDAEKTKPKFLSYPVLSQNVILFTLSD
jgi:hypothetical protein